jgi:septal ring factor EnvC (AmiA/AmiB activator)
MPYPGSAAPYPASGMPYPGSAVPYPLAVTPVPAKKRDALTIVFGVLMAVFFLSSAGTGLLYFSDHNASQNKISDQQSQITVLQKNADDARNALTSTKTELTSAQADLAKAQDDLKTAQAATGACETSVQAYFAYVKKTVQAGGTPSGQENQDLVLAMASACHASL